MGLPRVPRTGCDFRGGPVVLLTTHPLGHYVAFRLRAFLSVLHEQRFQCGQTLPFFENPPAKPAALKRVFLVSFLAAWEPSTLL